MASSSSLLDDLDITTAPVTALISHLESGALTSVALIRAYLTQIAKHNHAGLKLNAVISVAPEQTLLWQAEGLDRERREGRLRGKLHGLPVIVKVCLPRRGQSGPKHED